MDMVGIDKVVTVINLLSSLRYYQPTQLFMILDQNWGEFDLVMRVRWPGFNMEQVMVVRVVEFWGNHFTFPGFVS